MNIPIYPHKIPTLTTPQMVEVDQAMTKDYHVELIQMMENAGRNLAHLARARFLNGNPINKKIVILAGAGGNGGGALVCARRLQNWGARVKVFITKPLHSFQGVPAHQLDILQRMHVPIKQVADIQQAQNIDLIIDGIIGYSLSGSPRGTAADLIQWAENQQGPILSLDTPSGLDASTGTVFDPAIRATATMTLALPKQGLLAAEAGQHVGELYLADISVPPELYNQPGLKMEVGPIFAHNDIVRLR